MLIALVYHLNLHHYSLSPKDQFRFLDHDLEKLIEAIKVPVNMSLTMEDLATIKERSPKVYDLMINHSRIKFFPSIFSHSLVQTFSEDIGLQLAIGKCFQEKLIPVAKLLPVGVLPEYSFEPQSAKDFSRYWRYTMIDSEIVNCCSLLDCHFLYQVGDQKSKHFLVCLHKFGRYRAAYHRFLRERASLKEVCDAIVKDGNDFSEIGAPLVCHIDFEAPLFNRVEIFSNKAGKAGRLLPSRLDLFAALQNEFRGSGIKFVFLTKKYLDQLEAGCRKLEIETRCFAGRRETLKSRQKVTFLKKNRSQFLAANPLLYLSCTTSDYFVYNRKKLVLGASYRGRNGQVVIKRCGNWNDDFRKKVRMFDLGEKKIFEIERYFCSSDRRNFASLCQKGILP